MLPVYDNILDNCKQCSHLCSYVAPNSLFHSRLYSCTFRKKWKLLKARKCMLGGNVNSPQCVEKVLFLQNFKILLEPKDVAHEDPPLGVGCIYSL